MPSRMRWPRATRPGSSISSPQLGEGAAMIRWQTCWRCARTDKKGEHRQWCQVSGERAEWLAYFEELKRQALSGKDYS